jgi:hypothetical protein
VIDDHSAVTYTLKYTVAAENDCPDIRIVTDTAEYDFSLCSRSGRRISYDA